jgi:hypothetical protein
VNLIEHDNANGVLTLDGPNSVLQTLGVDFRNIGLGKENGWFDLQIRAPKGNIILLHNSVRQNAQTYFLSDEQRQFSAEIYPNMVVEDVRGLDDDRRVRRANFRVTGMDSFFCYQHVEPLLGFDGSEGQVDALSSMRYQRENSVDPFAPRHVYVTHELPKYFEIEVEDRIYEVFAGAREHIGSLHKIDYEAFPIASITFKSPVELDEMVGHVIAWRRLFSQLAMRPLAIEQLTVGGSTDEHVALADVYLTNSAHEKWATKGYYSLSPFEQPFNDWANREQLGEAHRSWLLREPERRRFRIALDKVLRELASRSGASQLIELASGIESLKELGGSNDYPREIIQAMAEAAQSVSVENKRPVPLDRICGLLGNLGRPSLAHVMREMGRKALVSQSDVELIVSAAGRIRNQAAHGRNVAGEKFPFISPTVRGLAALCARFDLVTSGFPVRKEQSIELMPGKWLRDALEELRYYLDSDRN